MARVENDRGKEAIIVEFREPRHAAGGESGARRGEAASARAMIALRSMIIKRQRHFRLPGVLRRFPFHSPGSAFLAAQRAAQLE
jgi:hypothetical protein